MLNRILPLLVTMALAPMVKGQTPGYIFFETTAAVDMSQLKFIIEAVQNADPAADVFHSDDMTILQVRHSGGLTEAAYRVAIEQTGVALRPGTRTAEDLGLNQVDANAPPVFVVTNDPAADELRYRAAVEIWNAAHPDQLMNATPVHSR